MKPRAKAGGSRHHKERCAYNSSFSAETRSFHCLLTHRISHLNWRAYWIAHLLANMISLGWTVSSDWESDCCTDPCSVFRETWNYWGSKGFNQSGLTSQNFATERFAICSSLPDFKRGSPNFVSSGSYQQSWAASLDQAEFVMQRFDRQLASFWLWLRITPTIALSTSKQPSSISFFYWSQKFSRQWLLIFFRGLHWSSTPIYWSH